MAEWILGVSKAAALGWARGPGKRSERRSRLKAIRPNAMRSFWKVAAFRLTGSIQIQSGRRALRCFQNELHHFIILNRKWYKVLIVSVTAQSNVIHNQRQPSIDLLCLHHNLLSFTPDGPNQNGN